MNVTFKLTAKSVLGKVIISKLRAKPFLAPRPTSTVVYHALLTFQFGYCSRTFITQSRNHPNLKNALTFIPDSPKLFPPSYPPVFTSRPFLTNTNTFHAHGLSPRTRLFPRTRSIPPLLTSKVEEIIIVIKIATGA